MPDWSMSQILSEFLSQVFVDYPNRRQFSFDHPWSISMFLRVCSLFNYFFTVLNTQFLETGFTGNYSITYHI